MTKDQIARLRIGDLVRLKSRGEAYLVIRDGSDTIAMRTIGVTNPTLEKIFLSV